jgi:hypothetical protein
VLTSFCLPGTGCPKVINLEVNGELVEGNILTGVPEIAWCGGTPGKGVARFVYETFICPVEVLNAFSSI